MMGIDTELQNEKYKQSVREFVRRIESLPEALFLKKIDDWAPRDVTAHLIGWNHCTIEGCQQIKNGETPSYFIDPGEDYCKINAVLVKEYDSKDKNELINQLNDSTEKLSDHLNALDPADWETDFGITYHGQTITIKNTVDALISDFINHRQQIEKWADEETK